MATEKADDSSVIRDWARGGREIGRRLAAAGRSVTGVSYSYGTVQQVGTTGTLDVLIDGDDTVRRGLKMTTACRGAAAGDRVLVLKSGRLSTVTGVLAHDNDPYVTETEHDSDIAGVESDLASAMVPRYVSLTPNESLANYSAYANSSYKLGRLVVLQCGILFSKATTLSSSTLRLFALPSDCRPAEDVSRARMALCVCDGGDTAIARGINVTASGSVQFQNASGGTQGINGIFVYGIGYAAAS